jgi:lipid-A-disaccharide synthase
MKPILIIAGEHSGDNLGAGLMKALLENSQEIEFFGIGGEQMKALGLESLANMEELTVIGFVAAALKYRKLKQIAKNIVKLTLSKNCQYVILVDYPGFNLALAEMLKKANPSIKIIFYVSPQIWAWKYKRIFKIKKLVDLMLLLFPFEKEIYDKHEIPNVFVGHPIVVEMPKRLTQGREIFTDLQSRVICLMPGSRSGEIRRLLVPILETAVLLTQHYTSKNQKLEFLLPGISQKEEAHILQQIEIYTSKYPNLKIHYHPNNSAKCIEKSEAVIVASGTATLEVAYLEKPMVIIYKTSWLTAFLARKFFLLIPYVGLVNVLSQKFICKELLQEECTPKNIFEETLKLLEDFSYREEMIKNLRSLKQSLGCEDPSYKASQAILKLIS